MPRPEYRTELLREARDRQGLRNVDIAKRLRIDPSLVSLTLNGRRHGQRTVRRIARFLGVEMDDLYVAERVGKGAA